MLSVRQLKKKNVPMIDDFNIFLRSHLFHFKSFPLLTNVQIICFLKKYILTFIKQTNQSKYYFI